MFGKEFPLKKTLITLAFCLAGTAPAWAADPLPCILSNGINGADGGGFPKTVLSADFDGDGYEDRACALLAELDADGPVDVDIEFGPFDHMGYPLGGVTTLETYDNSTMFGDKELFIAQPGLHNGLCVKGYGPCEYGEEAYVYTKNPSVGTGTEGASWAYIYIGRNPTNPEERLFRTFFMSD